MFKSKRYDNYEIEEEQYGQHGHCSGRRVLCALLSLVLILLAVISGLLLAALIRALTMEVPEYVDEATLQRILQQPNMTSENFLQLPKILGKALTFPTVVNASGEFDEVPFIGLHDHLRQTFSHVFSSPVVEVEGTFPSLLLTVRGSEDSSGGSNSSYLLLAHLDVVPVEAAAWTAGAPWGGVWEEAGPEEDGGYVVGRGALDNKLTVVAMLCALDELLGDGWQPNNTFYIALGHDEEVGGEYGAKELAKILIGKGVQDLFFILDEGMPVLAGVIKGVEVPVATIGVTEKGWLSVRLEATGIAGHSSMPPLQQATHSLATAVHNLATHPQPSMMGTGPEEQLLGYVAPKAVWPHRLVLSNPWLFRPLLSYIMSQGRESDALQRTTTATTIMRAGLKDNVVPGTAWAVVNHRVHPGQTLEQVVEHDRAAINDPNVKVSVIGSKAPPPTSPFGPAAPAFSLIAAIVRRFYPTAIPAPALLVGNTDTRHYLSLSSAVYRFQPILLTPQDVAGIHGHNERVSAANVWRSAGFFHSLMLSADQGLGMPGNSRPKRRAREL